MHCSVLLRRLTIRLHVTSVEMKATSRQERGPEWIGRLPVTITPNEFHNLIHARMACRSSPATTNFVPPSQLDNISADRDPPDHSKFSKSQYLKAYKSLALTPKPSTNWLGSPWQRQRAESLLNQTAPLVRESQAAAADETPDANRTDQGSSRRTNEPDSGPSDPFLLELQARRRDELRKSREKQEERKRLQQEQARTHSKLLRLKKAKLQALDKQRIMDRDQAVLDLESNNRALQELSSKVDDVRMKLDQIKGAKHNAVTLLKKQMAAPAGGTPALATCGDPERPAQRRAGVDGDKFQYSWIQPRAPFSPGDFIERLFGLVKDDVFLQPSAEDRLKRKRDAQGHGPDVPQAADKVPRTAVSDNNTAASMTKARTPATPFACISGVRGKPQTLGAAVAHPLQPANTIPLPPPMPGKPKIGAVQEPQRPVLSNWSPPHALPISTGANQSNRELLPAPPPGKPPPRPARQPYRGPQLHNMPPPIALPSPGDLPRPPPSMMGSAEASKNWASGAYLPGPP